jgi:hypothetical protein
VAVLGMLLAEQSDTESGGASGSSRFRLRTEFVFGWRSAPRSALADSTRSEAVESADLDPLRIL